MLHLDLCPANIIITTQGQSVKLIDLGMAFSDAFTSTYGGTKGYTAPEVMAKSGDISTSADIYSIGRIMAMIGCKVSNVISRCVSDNASQRYRSVEQLRRAIVNSHRRRRWLIISAIIAIVLIVGIAAFHENHSDSSVTPSVDTTTETQKNESTLPTPSETPSTKTQENESHHSDVNEDIKSLTQPAVDAETNSSESNHVSTASDEQYDAREAAQRAQQEQLYNHIVKVVDAAYTPIVQLIASPPADKNAFLKQFLALKETAENTYAAALQQGYDKYSVTLSEKQYQQLGDRIHAIEENFYIKYNE